MQLNLNVPAAELTKQFEAVVKERYQQLARDRISEYFARKNDHGSFGKTADGIGTLFVNEIIDNLLSDEKLQTKIKGHVEKHFDRIIEEAAITAMTHRAKKIAFTEDAIVNKSV